MSLRTRLTGRIALGVAGLAVSAVVTGAVLVAHPSLVTAKPLSLEVTPVPTDAVAACPGPVLAAAVGSATDVGSFAPAAVTAGVADGSAKPTDSALQAPDDKGSGGAPVAYSAPAAPEAAAAPPLAAAQSQLVARSDLAGFAATGCGEPTADAWLSAGSADLGENSLLLLANPGGVAATVDVSVYDEEGPVTSAGGKGIIVKARSQRAISLAGLAPNSKATVVHVSATGGSVVARLQQSSISGITPQGVDIAGTTAPPAKRQIIPGAVFTTMSAVGKGANDGVSPTAPVLRVLVPGSQPADLEIGIAGEKGTKGGAAKTVTVAGDTVQEVPLTGLADGSYTITVDSTRPAVVSLRTSTVSSAGTDFAWWAAAATLGDEASVAVATGPSPRLHLANPGDEPITATITDGTKKTSVTVPARATTGVSAPSGPVLLLSGAKGLYASVSYTGPAALAGYTVSPQGGSASPLRVYVG